MEEQKENLEITHHPKEGSSWKWIAILAVAVLALTQIYAIGKNAQKKSSADSNQNNEAEIQKMRFCEPKALSCR